MRKLILLCLALVFLAAPLQSAVLVGFGQSSGVSATDSFTGADNANIGDSGLWATPKTADGTYSDPFIYSNAISFVSSRSGIAYRSDPVFSANHKSCVTLNIVGTAGPAVRITSADQDTMYSAYVSGTAYVVNKHSNSGTPSTLITTGVNQTAGDVICLSATGTSTTSLSLTINGGTAYTYDDSSSPITTGYPGLRGRRGTTNPSVDNWTGDDL